MKTFDEAFDNLTTRIALEDPVLIEDMKRTPDLLANYNFSNFLQAMCMKLKREVSKCRAVEETDLEIKVMLITAFEHGMVIGIDMEKP